MPNFSYSARDAGGQLVRGMVEGATASAVADQLIGGSMTPVDITSAAEVDDGAGWQWPTWQRPSAVQPDELMLFSRQLHSLLRAGVPIVRALTGLQESTSGAMRAVLVYGKVSKAASTCRLPWRGKVPRSTTSTWRWCASAN